MARYSDQILLSGVPVTGAEMHIFAQDGLSAEITDDYGLDLNGVARSEAYGNIAFNAADGVYLAKVYYQGRLRYEVQNLVVGDAQSLFKGDTGNTGPSNNTFSTAAALAASPVTNLSGTFAGGDWLVSDASAYAAAIAADVSGAYFIMSTDDPSKVWVRQTGNQPLLVDDFYILADGADNAKAFARAFAVGSAMRRNVRCTPAASYRFYTSVEIWPLADGWVPALDGAGCTITLGHAVPVLADEYAGFRYRGVKSGALANAIGPKISNLTIDASNINASNGVRSIWMENASEWDFDRVHGVNYFQGYHIANWRYADGGSQTGKPGRVTNCVVSGNVLASTAGKTWYPYSEAGDLTCARTGDSVAVGETTMIATVQTGVSGNNVPKLSLSTLWKNETAASIAVPADLSEAGLLSSGLTKIGTSAALDHAPGTPTVSAFEYMYYTTGGDKCAFGYVTGADNLVQDCEFYGGRYGAYVQCCDGARFVRVKTSSAVRGIVGEWSAINGVVEGCTITETLSSAHLVGFGCSGWSANNLTIIAKSARWIGEALVNIQLNSGRYRGRGIRTETRTTVTDGQYHVNIGPGCSDTDIEVSLRGDCAKAFVAVQSAYVQNVGPPPSEAYAGAYAGGAKYDLTDVTIRGSIAPDTTKAVGAGPTLVALIQENDGLYGEIGLLRVNIEDFRADKNKTPSKYLALYEGATAAKQISGCTLRNAFWPIETVPATAASRIILPRKWAHFALVRNVTNLDDEVERTVPNVATPDLTFGKYWFDTGSTALNGILGGQGSSSTEGYEGREIVVRGNSSRAWSTVSATSGTKDGLRITGTPVTPSNVQRMRLTYSKTQASWIGGVV